MSAEIFQYAGTRIFDESLFSKAKERFDEEIHQTVLNDIIDHAEYEAVRNSLLDSAVIHSEGMLARLKHKYPNTTFSPDDMSAHIAAKWLHFFTDYYATNKDLRYMFLRALEFYRSLPPE